MTSQSPPIVEQLRSLATFARDAASRGRSLDAQLSPRLDALRALVSELGAEGPLGGDEVESAGTAVASLVGTVEQVDQAIGGHVARLDSETVEVEGSVTAALEAVEDHDDVVTQAGDALATALDSLAAAAGDADSEVATNGDATIQAASGLTSEVGEQEAAAVAANERTIAELHAYDEALGGELATRRDAAFQTLDTAVDEDLGAALIDGAVVSTELAVVADFGTLGSTVALAATRVQDTGEQLLQGLADHAGHAVTGAVDAAFGELVDVAIDALATEITQQVVVMGIGATVTGVLGPILPELVVAKKLLDLMDSIFSPF